MRMQSQEGSCWNTVHRIASLVVAIGLVAGCSDAGDPVAAPMTPDASFAVASAGGEMGELTVKARQDLATLRRVVAPFHDFDTAVAAGWAVQLTPCLEHPEEGGMGYHYANVALIDGEATVEAPEALLYEPQKNGKLRFVGVEYIVPLPLSEDPPVLFDQEFVRNEEVGIWALHVWVGRQNPSGLFADWNPKVTCEHAPEL